MQIDLRQRLFARLCSVGLAAALLGCAASPVDPADEEGRDDDDPALVEDAGAADPDAPDAATSGDAATRADGQVAADAQVVRDAAVPRDATLPARDAALAPADASAPPPARDAAPPASTVDAAADASRPVDASAVDAAAPRDAATPGANGRCQRSSDCDAVCAFTGILPCCREDRTCGCTWAPGAYCL